MFWYILDYLPTFPEYLKESEQEETSRYKRGPWMIRNYYWWTKHGSMS